MALTVLQVKNVCLVNQGSSACRYLAQDDYDISKYYCLKKASEKKDIDKEVSEYISECKNVGKDPDDDGYPLGDNCDGYITLLTKPQGYDQP